MHPGQITALTGALAATMITLVAYMSVMSGNPSKMFIKSTWHLTLVEHDVDQTWYINTDDNIIKIVEKDEETATMFVQEIHSDASYDYEILDPDDYAEPVPKEACDDVDLSEYDGDCDDYRAELQANIEGMAGNKAECSETLLTEETFNFAASLPCDGKALVGQFMVHFSSCVPTSIIDDDSGDVIATINSIVDGIDDSVTFSKCEQDGSDEEGRRLNWIIERFFTGTDWCGGGTDLNNAPCPGSGRKARSNRACRRHDHGIIGAPASGLPIPMLECQNDRELDKNNNDFIINAVYGDFGIARSTGCLNYSKFKNNKKNKWKNGKTVSTWYKDTWGWEIRKGKARQRMCDEIEWNPSKGFFGCNNRQLSQVYNAIPGTTIPHVRGPTNDYEKNKAHWFFHDIPKSKVYKPRDRVCPLDEKIYEICWDDMPQGNPNGNNYHCGTRKYQGFNAGCCSAKDSSVDYSRCCWTNDFRQCC